LISYRTGSKEEKPNKLHQDGSQVMLLVVSTMDTMLTNVLAAASNLQNKAGVIHVSTATTPLALSLAVP
jgi:hypothetical protein